MNTLRENEFPTELAPPQIVLTRRQHKEFIMANPPNNKPAGGPASEPGARTSQDLEAEIARLREDLTKLTQQISATGSHSYAAAKTAAQEGVDLLRSKGEDAMATARNNAQLLEDELTDAVREKPLTALALAAAVGYFFAVLRR